MHLLLLCVFRGVFEQDVEGGYHQHLPDICHGETPPSAGWTGLRGRQSPAGSFLPLLTLKREIKEEFVRKRAKNKSVKCVSSADVLATTRRQNTALDSAYGQWTLRLPGSTSRRSLACGGALIRDETSCMNVTDSP